MKNISRRNFINTSLTAAAGAALTGSDTTAFMSSETSKKYGIKVFIPMPLQIVIDDVGWWSGEDGSKRQEPYRTGIVRNHVPADYQAICDLGHALGVRPQAATIMCEWDKENILGSIPSATWMGEKWNNSRWIGPWMEEAADIIRKNRKNYELTLHGVGHEYWENGTFTRAEWTDSNGMMRPPDQVEKHLDAYEKLLDQHGLGPMPESFVPAAFRHCFGVSAGRQVSLAQLLGKRGIRYINTPFRIMYNKEKAQNRYFGFDSGVITIDRGEDQFNWDVFPAVPESEIHGPTIGMHWPNMLHPNPERNGEIVERWINCLRPCNNRADMMLAPDSVSFRNQLVHNQLTTVLLKEKSFELDLTGTDNLPGDSGKKEIIIRVLADRPFMFSSESVSIISQTVRMNDDGHLHTITAERKDKIVRPVIDYFPA